MKKELTGTVISTKMNKTIVVKVVRKKIHPLYRKVMTVTKRFKVHNELKGIEVGDTVVFQETKPISKEKHFIAIKKV